MQSTPKRGRPPSADPSKIARVALRLFERDGFDAVTMHEVADAAKVSVRTLFRLFPTKSDLVWEELKSVRVVVAARVAELRGAGLPAGAAVLALAEPFLRPIEAPAVARLARRRLRVIADAPALLDHEALREIEADIASLFDPTSAPPALVARAVVAMTFAALFWWAEQDKDVTPMDALEAALRGVTGAPPRSDAPASRRTAPTDARDRA